jgi:hypothetical protein
MILLAFVAGVIVGVVGLLLWGRFVDSFGSKWFK